MQHLQKTGGPPSSQMLFSVLAPPPVPIPPILRTLFQVSVSRKPFACHSSENTRGVGVFFPFRNSSAERSRQGFVCSEISTFNRRSQLRRDCRLWTESSVERGNFFPFLPPPMQIVHRNIQINVAARRRDADHQRFGVRAARQTRFVHVNFWRKHFEMKALVVQQRHRIPDDHVRHLANRFPHHLVARFHFCPREQARHLHRHVRRQIENHAPFNVSLDGDQRGNALAAIRFLLHFQVHDFRRRLQRLRENRIRGANKRLNQFHSHERCSPAIATGAPTALGSSLSTYRKISYRTSGFTGFCTKCFAPFCRAARIFSWYPSDETMTMRALACCRTMRSTASIPSICGMVMSMSTMSGVVRLNSAMAVKPSPASPATSPPNISIILMRFLRAKTESSTTR